MEISSDIKVLFATRLIELINIALQEGTAIHTAFMHHCRIEFCDDMDQMVGYAHVDRLVIDLNGVLIEDNLDAFLNEVLPHELAHLIITHTFGNHRNGHGKIFKYICDILGCRARAVIPMNTIKSRKVAHPEVTFYSYECACAIDPITESEHNERIATKTKYRCKKCKSIFLFNGDVL